MVDSWYSGWRNALRIYEVDLYRGSLKHAVYEIELFLTHDQEAMSVRCSLPCFLIKIKSVVDHCSRTALRWGVSSRMICARCDWLRRAVNQGDDHRLQKT